MHLLFQETDETQAKLLINQIKGLRRIVYARYETKSKVPLLFTKYANNRIPCLHKAMSLNKYMSSKNFLTYPHTSQQMFIAVM